jgi:hypothetical protein
MRVFVEAEFPTTDVTSLSRGIYICQIKAMAIKPMRSDHMRAWKVCSCGIVVVALWMRQRLNHFEFLMNMVRN